MVLGVPWGSLVSLEKIKRHLIELNEIESTSAKRCRPRAAPGRHLGGPKDSLGTWAAPGRPQGLPGRPWGGTNGRPLAVPGRPLCGPPRAELGTKFGNGLGNVIF